MINKIGHYSLENPASIYDEEAMTALELAGRTAKKVNEVIDQSNKLDTDTRNWMAKTESETIPGVVDMKVKDHIENGDFDAQIGEHMGNLNDRVNNVLNNIPAGGTIMDAEVIDGRLGIDSTVYNDLGTAIRMQAKTASAKGDDFKKQFNHYEIYEITGYLGVQDGVRPRIAPDEGYTSLISEVIACKPGDVFTIRASGWASINNWVFMNMGTIVGAGCVGTSENTTIELTAPAGTTHVIFGSTNPVANGTPILEIVYNDPDSVSNKLEARITENAKLIENWGIYSHSGYLGANNKFSDDTSLHCKATRLIRTEPGEIFHYYGRSYNAAMGWLFFADDGVTVIGSGNNGEIGYAYAEVTIPDGCRYVVFSSFEHNVQYPVTLEIKWDNPGTISNRLKNITEDCKYANPILAGKKWIACGDSFTHGDFNGIEDLTEYQFQDGPYAGQNIMYPQIIGLRNNMDVHNVAVNGRTMAITDTNNNFMGGQYYGLDKDADIITVRLGINDMNQAVPIGTNDDTDSNTFKGAWNVCFRHFLTAHPYAKIGVIVSNGMTGEYAEAIRVMCRKWGIPYLDISGGYQVPLMHRVEEKSEVCAEAKALRDSAFRVSTPNSHPNVQAEYYESTYIENWLCSL